MTAKPDSTCGATTKPHLTDVTCDPSYDDALTVDVIVGRKPCKFVIDNGTMVSFIKRGISQKLIRDVQVVAKSATGDELKVFGVQKVGFIIEGTKVYHDFVVADLCTGFDGLFGLDLLRKLNVYIDFSNNDIYVGGEQVTNSEETREPGTEMEGTGHLNPPVEEPEVWSIVTIQDQSIPPKSEMLVQGRLPVSYTHLDVYKRQA